MTDFDYIIDLCSKDNQRKNWTIVFTEKSPTVTLTNEDLVADSISFTESVITGNEIKFGQLERSQISFKFANTDNISFMKYDIFTVKVYIGGYDIGIGTFEVETVMPDKNGLFDIIGYSADSYVTDNKPSKFNQYFSGTIGYMYYWLLNEIGMSIIPNGYNPYNYLSFTETANTKSEYGNINISGEWKRYKSVYHEKICTIPSGIRTSYNHFFPFLPKNQYSISSIIRYGANGGDSVIYNETSGSESTISEYEWDRFEDNRFGIVENGSFLNSVRIYDRVQIYLVVDTVETYVTEFNIYNDAKLYYENYTTLPNPFGLVNGDWAFRPKYDGDEVRRLENTASEILSAICELNAVCMKQSRTGGFEIFSLKTGNIYLPSTSLFPSTTLYPSETLYPNGSLLLYDLKKQYLNELEYAKSDRNYFRKLITPIVLDEESGEGARLYMNVDGIVDYDISDNILINTFNFNSEFDGYPAQTHLENLVSQMTDIKMDMFSLKAIGFPNVPVGSKIEIQTPSGEIVQSIIMQRQLKGIQHLEDTIKNNINGGI